MVVYLLGTQYRSKPLNGGICKLQCVMNMWNNVDVVVEIGE